MTKAKAQTIVAECIERKLYDSRAREVAPDDYTITVVPPNGLTTAQVQAIENLASVTAKIKAVEFT